MAFFMVFSLFWSACQSDPSPKTGEELEKLKAELEAKKKELKDKQQIAELEKEMKALDQQIKAVDKGIAPAPAVGMAPPQSAPVPETSGPKGTITGSAVTMRKSASVQSDKMGSFKPNEVVSILETQNVNNENEAILVKPIALFESASGDGASALTLPKGKAVVIENYDADQNKYKVSYQDAKKGKLYAQIDADALETISYSTWYKVQRSTGETGWVLGKFLKL